MELTQGRAFILVVGALCLLVLVVGLVFLHLLRRDRVPWRVLSGYYPGARWYSEVDIDPKRIVQALQAAEQCLIERTTWNAANMALVGHYVRVQVCGSESWSKLYGDTRLGYDCLRVGPSLSGLCHELAHLAEIVIDSRVSGAHEEWKALGVEKALEEYDQWLVKLVQTENVATGVIPISRGHWLTGMSACRHRRPE